MIFLGRVITNVADWSLPEYITLRQAAEAFQIQTVYSYEDCLDMLKYAISRGFIIPICLEGEKDNG